MTTPIATIQAQMVEIASDYITKSMAIFQPEIDKLVESVSKNMAQFGSNDHDIAGIKAYLRQEFERTAKEQLLRDFLEKVVDR